MIYRILKIKIQKSKFINQKLKFHYQDTKNEKNSIEYNV